MVEAIFLNFISNVEVFLIDSNALSVIEFINQILIKMVVVFMQQETLKKVKELSTMLEKLSLKNKLKNLKNLIMQNPSTYLI